MLNHQTHDDPKFKAFTALHFASVEHEPAIAATLVKLGADIDLENDDG